MLRDLLKLYHRKWHWMRAGIVFVHVPKAAGNSLSLALYGRFLGHYTAMQINAFDPGVLRQLPSFGVVRNPWDRCVSAFRFAKRTVHGDGVTPSISSDVRRRLQPYESSEAFICDWLRHQDVNEADYVFQEQAHFLCDGQSNTLVDFVGRIEALDVLEAWLQKSLHKPVKIPRHNQSGDVVSHHEWYSAETRAIVGKIYGRDISKFGYEF